MGCSAIFTAPVDFFAFVQVCPEESAALLPRAGAALGADFFAVADFLPEADFLFTFAAVFFAAGFALAAINDPPLSDFLRIFTQPTLSTLQNIDPAHFSSTTCRQADFLNRGGVALNRQGFPAGLRRQRARDKAAAPPTRSAAAQLNHFSLREKSGFEQCSQTAPNALAPLSAARSCPGPVAGEGLPILLTGNSIKPLRHVPDWLGGGIAPAVLPHHRAYGSVPRRFM
jgi:hypothetical protein